MTDLPVIGAQDGTGFRRRHRRTVVSALGRVGRCRSAVAALRAVVAIGPILALETGALALANPVVAKAIVAWTAELAIRPIAPVVLAPVVLVPVVLVPVALSPVALAPIVMVPVVLAPIALAPVEAILAPPFFARARLAIAAVVTLVGALGIALRAILAVGLGGFGLTAFVFEIDVIAGDELVPANDVGQGALRLHRAHDSKIVFGMLQVVFSQDPVTGGVGVARQLLVFFINMLGSAPHLDAVRSIGVESPVGVMLRLAAAAAATPAAIAVAVALALYAFEISHLCSDLLREPQRQGPARAEPVRGSLSFRGQTP